MAGDGGRKIAIKVKSKGRWEKLYVITFYKIYAPADIHQASLDNKILKVHLFSLMTSKYCQNNLGGYLSLLKYSLSLL